ncbi:MAG: UvrD-helicase domain-containing protein [Gemmatimonadetes bacterium]|nr:UvrD-helicase domain-containing protein [Gemmatimonadota bacterium]
MSVAPRPLPAQRRTIDAPLGPLLVIAGPGAGKTYCLIQRVAHLIRVHRIPPQRICAVTFTNKAAEEVAGRLRDTLDRDAEAVTRGTLHWLCAGILRDHAGAVGLRPGFGIADEPYQLSVLARLGVWKKRRRQLLNLFGRRRLQGRPLHGPDEQLFQRYLGALRQRNVADFDDLISLTDELFRRRPVVADAVAGRWDYVLVDEGQDLDPTQYAILKRLAAGHRNLFVVGDDEQSIFSWRGAEPAVLRRFQEEFGIAAPIVLDKNRRCSHQIFETARRLVAGNPNLFEKRLSAERRSEHEVVAYGFADETAEAEWILADLVADRARSGRWWGAYAVLYRRHEQGDPLEQRLLAAGVPCRLAHGRAVSEDEVIAHVVACLRLMRDPDDPAAQEALAARVLPEHLLERLRSDPQTGGVVAAVRAYARRAPRGEPDARRAWRYIRQVENLAALRRAHATLAGVVPELLVQRVGKYANVLEDRYEELTDPARHDGARRLAERLQQALSADGRIWLDAAGGAEVALRGMLQAAGYVGVGYLTRDPSPQLADVVLGSDDAGPDGLTVTAFKALQLLHAKDFEAGFRDYVAFDLETTDLNSDVCDIVELAAVRVRGDQPVAEFRTLLKGTRPISPRATAVHGYRDEDVADAPTLGGVWPRFLAFAGGDVLVAHNGQKFDVPVLRRVARGLDGLERLTFFDTYPLARSLWRDSARLGSLAARFGIDVGREHHALDDAKTLVRVFGKLSEQRLSRARTATLTNLLDYVGLGMVLEGAGGAGGAAAGAAGPDGRDGTRDGGDWQVLFEVASSFALGRYSECLEWYAQERQRLARDDLPPPDQVIERLGGRERMERLRAEPDPARRYPASMARLEGLIETSAADTLEESIRRFLERVALSTSEGPDVAPDRVNLLTLHATKGLEFDCVYIVGAEDGQLPGGRFGHEVMRGEIEEARRLLYVGMTRARDRLVLTRARERGGLPGGGNRFLDEMGLKPVYVQPVTAP